MRNLGNDYRRMEQSFKEYSVFLTAVELGLFDLLTKPLLAGQLAEKAGTHPRLTKKLLDLLVAFGYIVKTDEVYSNTQEATAFFTKFGDYYSKTAFDYLQNVFHRFAGLTERLKVGPITEDKRKNIFEPEAIRTMANVCLLGRLQEIVSIVADLPWFSNACCMMDIGGAHGLFSIAMCQENPNLSAVVFDQPSVAEVTAEYITIYNMQDRVSTLTGDHGADPFGKDYDFIFESFTFWGNKTKMTDYFSRIYEALVPGGRLVSVRSLLDNDRKAPMSTLLRDLEYALSDETQSYLTQREFSLILEEAGFSEIQFIGDSQELSWESQVVTAVK